VSLTVVKPVVRRREDGVWEVEAMGRVWQHSQPWQVAVFYQMALALLLASNAPGQS
jgi:hypothetical protein